MAYLKLQFQCHTLCQNKVDELEDQSVVVCVMLEICIKFPRMGQRPDHPDTNAVLKVVHVGFGQLLPHQFPWIMPQSTSTPFFNDCQHDCDQNHDNAQARACSRSSCVSLSPPHRTHAPPKRALQSQMRRCGHTPPVNAVCTKIRLRHIAST